MPDAATLSPADSGRGQSIHRKAVCSWTHHKAQSNQTPPICLTQHPSCCFKAKSYWLRNACNSYCPIPPGCILSTVESFQPAEEIQLHGRESHGHPSPLRAVVGLEREHTPTAVCD